MPTPSKEAVSRIGAEYEKIATTPRKRTPPAYAALAKAEQDLDRARQEAGSSMEAAPTASSQPATADEVSGDPQLADAQKKIWSNTLAALTPPKNTPPMKPSAIAKPWKPPSSSSKPT